MQRNEITRLLEAISFAARKHRHQLRNRHHVRNPDGTPYASHPFRVMAVLRHVFEVEDPALLTAAVLHDTIEDTDTDYDDLIDGGFTEETAKLVVSVTKDTRVVEDEREKEYVDALLEGGPAVMVLKLADIYDNVTDAAMHRPEDKLEKTLKKAREFLAACRNDVDASYPGVVGKVDALLKAVDP